ARRLPGVLRPAARLGGGRRARPGRPGRQPGRPARPRGRPAQRTEPNRGDDAMKTSLGIWALGPMVTRFVPGGYQPEHADESTAEKVARAVGGLGDLIDGYEFHYPAELGEDNESEVLEALAGHDVYCVATGLHLDPR